MQTFQTGGPVTVVVRTGSGHVSVTADDVPDTTVELTALNAAGEDAVAATRVDHHQGVVLVDVPRRGGGLFRSGPQVGVRVTCPSGSSLQVKAESADVRAEGSYALVDLLTGSGDLAIEHVTGTAKLKAGSGTVTTGSVEGTLVVTTGSGDVSLDRSGTTATVTVGSGDISIGSLAGDVVTKSGSGDVEVGVLEGSLLTKTGSGDLTVRRAASGAVRATGASGTISIGIQDGTAAWLDLSTVSGRVSQELGETAAPRDDQQRVEITAHTVSGDLRVHRS
jgi:DUF4097 and DUF4098 domain-containing protein YvlB